MNVKDIQSPWITSGTKKSSKSKQRVYEKVLKTRSYKSELLYKNYKKIFEIIEKYYIILKKMFKEDALFKINY